MKDRDMPSNLLLVGSIPYETVEEVMRVFGGALAKQLPAVPDGEVGVFVATEHAENDVARARTKAERPNLVSFTIAIRATAVPTLHCGKWPHSSRC